MKNITDIDGVAVNQLILQLKFDGNGLIATIAQDASSNEVLMLAWMSAESIKASFASGLAVYYSRSRQKLWQKGETSGNIQKIVDFRYDCDNDAILIKVKQTGVACHTGQSNCFYKTVLND